MKRPKRLVSVYLISTEPNDHQSWADFPLLFELVTSWFDHVRENRLCSTDHG